MVDALLGRVLDAHGGLDRWKKLSTLSARIRYGGPFWGFKGHADFVDVDTVEACMQKQYFRQFQESTGRTVVFDKSANRVTITGADGKVIEALDNPRATFAGYTTETKWSLAQVAYFRSYATWHDLVEPYIFTWPGVEAHEVEAVDGERTDVARPRGDVPRLDRRPQRDPAVLLRRRRSAAPDGYQPVVNGNRRVAHYIHSEATFARIVVPTQRYIYRRNEDRTPDLSNVSITLDPSDVKFS
jgi:hypothetical protein